MKFRHALTPIVLLALTFAMAAPVRADQDHHRDRRATSGDRATSRAQARPRTQRDQRATPEQRNRNDRFQSSRRNDRDNRRFERRDRDNRYERYDHYRYQPFISIVPPAVVVNPYRAYPWWSGSQRFSFGLYIGAVAPFSWSAPPPVFGGEPYAAYGAVTLNLHPDDALVYVDGYYVGRVEDVRSTQRPLTLVAGPHDVLVQARGYEPMQFSINVYAGQLIPYRGDLVRAGWR